MVGVDSSAELAESCGTTSVQGGVRTASTVLSPVCEAVPMLDSGCSFVLGLPFVDAGTGRTSEADAPSGGTTSVMRSFSPVTAMLFPVSEAMAKLGSGCCFVCGLHFADAVTEP